MKKKISLLIILTFFMSLFSISIKHSEFSNSEKSYDKEKDTFLITNKNIENTDIVKITEAGDLFINAKKVILKEKSQKQVAIYYQKIEKLYTQGLKIGIEGTKIGLEGAGLGIKALFRLPLVFVSPEKYQKALKADTEGLETKSEKLESKSKQLEFMADELAYMEINLAKSIDELDDINWFGNDVQYMNF